MNIWNWDWLLSDTQSWRAIKLVRNMNDHGEWWGWIWNMSGVSGSCCFVSQPSCNWSHMPAVWGLVYWLKTLSLLRYWTRRRKETWTYFRSGVHWANIGDRSQQYLKNRSDSILSGALQICSSGNPVTEVKKKMWMLILDTMVQLICLVF